MAGAKNIIEINGRAYNAETGQLLGPNGSVAKAELKAHTPKKESNAGAALDGVVSSHASHRVRKYRRNAQKSKTLMRSSLKKPKHEVPNLAADTARAKLPSTPANERFNRANRIQKSQHISKFGRGHLVPNKVVKKSANLTVAKPKAQQHSHVQPVVQQFEKAVSEATSHLETFTGKPRSRRSKKLAIASLAIVGLLGIGFSAMQLIPAAKVKYAGSRAGFSASLPAYSPAGFNLDGNVGSSSGEVTLSYSSNSDDRNYNIKQSPSNWTSQALLSNYVIPTYGSNYQVYESQGKTIYISDNSNATWVDGGKWYVLAGNAPLTSDQLQRIVNSL